MSNLARFLYTHNPFYLISAGCVLFGFRAVYQDGSNPNDAWMLAISLAAYTLLLAFTAVAIVRWGKVWDDARTVALLSILMCLALSSCFDATCHREPLIARVVLSSGWMFSISIVRLLTWGMPVKLPSVYRIPLLAMITLFFIFPLFLSSGFEQAFAVRLAWQVLLFPIACGLLILTLVPAARMGAAPVSNNGSPWPWPFYPWSIFFFLLLGMIGRSYLLTISFQMDQGTTSSFSLYYLVPILASTIIVLAECALTTKRTVALYGLAMASTLLPLVASIHGSSMAATQLTLEITQALASPVWITLVTTAILSAWLWLRGAATFKVPLVLMLVALSGLSTSSQVLSDFRFHNPLPLTGILVYQIIRLLRGANMARYLVALSLGVLTTVLVAPDLCKQQFGLIPIHLTLSGLLMGSFWFSDWLALRFRAWMAFWILPLMIGAQIAGIAKPELSMAASIYAGATILVAFGIYMATKLRVWRAATVAAISVSVLLVIGRLLSEQNWVLRSQANLALLAGAGCFMFGAIISASKAGFGLGLKGLLKGEISTIRFELFGKNAGRKFNALNATESHENSAQQAKPPQGDPGN